MDHEAALGTSATMTVTVTPEMAAAFDDEVVHPVYGTAALVRHMEQVSRRLLVPHLAEGEEGVGAALTVRQQAPVAVGAQVVLEATVTDATALRCVTEVRVRCGGRQVAWGSFEQAVVDLAAWRRRAGIDPSRE